MLSPFGEYRRKGIFRLAAHRIETDLASHAASMQDGRERQQIAAFSELASLGAQGRPERLKHPDPFSREPLTNLWD